MQNGTSTPGLPTVLLDNEGGETVALKGAEPPGQACAVIWAVFAGARDSCLLASSWRIRSLGL